MARAAGTGCRVLPFLAVGHGLGEGLFLLLVVVAQGAVAGGQVLVACGAVVGVGRSGRVRGRGSGRRVPPEAGRFAGLGGTNVIAAGGAVDGVVLGFQM